MESAASDAQVAKHRSHASARFCLNTAGSAASWRAQLPLGGSYAAGAGTPPVALGATSSGGRDHARGRRPSGLRLGCQPQGAIPTNP